MSLSRIRLKVSGYVQGVGFRFFVVDEARALGLKGYVRNEGDGGVEVVAEGDAGRLDELAGSIKMGPSAATITDVKIMKENYLAEFGGFDIRY